MKRLYRLCKIELRKAICNRGFLIAVIIGIALAVLSLIYQVSIYNNEQNKLNEYLETAEVTYNPDLPGNILFNHWIGAENGSLGTIVYFFVFPLLIVLPFGWSFATEMKSGYSKIMIVKCGRMRYFISKYLAVFVSSGLVMIIPMIFSVAATACYFPVVKPFVIDDVSYGVFSNSLFANLYYTKPFAFIIAYLLVDFFVCGLIACICMTTSIFIRQKFIVMIVPMLVCLGIEYITKYVYDLSSYYNYEISPFYYLKPVASRLPAAMPIILMTGVILFVITFILTGIWEKKHEIY